MVIRLQLLILLALPLQAAEIHVFAAASLSDALTEIATAYERRSSDRIAFNFGASSTLARQIQAGAPADLFLSADEQLIDPRRRVRVLSNTLVVVVPRDGGANVSQPRQLLRLERIALAEPHSVPAGIYARRWLQSIGLWDAVKPKVIPTDNVRAALAAVASGNADAAIVYKTDALISRRVRVAHEVHGGPRISYAFAVTTEAPQADAARRFLAYLQSAEAMKIFGRYGFARAGQ